MRPQKACNPYSLFKKPSSDCSASTWYARFWDAENKRYFATRSTGILEEGKRERRAEAERIARNMVETVKADAEAKKKPPELNLLTYLEACWQPDSP